MQIALSSNDLYQSERELAIVLIVFNILFYLQLGDESQKFEYASWYSTKIFENCFIDSDKTKNCLLIIEDWLLSFS